MSSTLAPGRPALPATPAPRPPLGQLWQVPTFLLGVLFVAGVWLTRPLWEPVPKTAVDQQIQALREMLAQPEFEEDAVLALGQEILRGGRREGAQLGEVHYLLGSAHTILAERADAGGLREHWLRARYHLEQAEVMGIPEPEHVRLRFRLGKAWAETGQAPQRVIDLLGPAIAEGTEDPIARVQGYGYLAQAYLALPEPDLEGALKATEDQLRQPLQDDKLLAPARLQRGELLLKLGEDEQAREALKNLGEAAPADIVAQARRLRVQSLEGDGLWAEAATVWQEILGDPHKVPADRHVILYHLGLCHRRSGATVEAIRAWEECVGLDVKTDEIPAAALGLAELRSTQGEPTAVLQAFQRAVRDIKVPSDWRNELVRLPQAREPFETVCETARQAGEYEFSAQVARLYERLALPGRAEELRGLAMERAGRAEQEQARQAAEPEKVLRIQQEARRLLTQAGEAYEACAGARTDLRERGEAFWKSATLYHEGQAHERAVTAFTEFLKIAQGAEARKTNLFDARLAEGWFELAESHRALHHDEATFAALNECLKWPGRHAYRARYQIALLLKSRGQLDDSVATLEQNLDMLRLAREDRDNEAKEKTLFALGDMYFGRISTKGEVSRVIHVLEGALEEFPNSPDALVGHYQLAESYRLLAEDLGRSLGAPRRMTHEAQLRIQREIARSRDRAIQHYHKLVEVLRTRSQRSATEEELLVYAEFAAADQRFWLGEYESAGRLFEDLARQYRGRFEQFLALTKVVRSYALLMRATPASDPNRGKYEARKNAAMNEIRVGLQFDGIPPQRRKEFEDFLKLYAEPNPLSLEE